MRTCKSVEMSICDSLLLAKYQQLLAHAARTNLNNNNNTVDAFAHKIWNPAFTESDHERRTKQLLMNSFHHHHHHRGSPHSHSGLSSLLTAQHAAAVGGLLPPTPKLVIPNTVQPTSTYQVSCKATLEIYCL